MNVIKDSVEITLEVREDELLEGKYLHWQLLSQKVKATENGDRLVYFNLRNRLHNSFRAGKFNMTRIAGLNCIDVDSPMSSDVSSLVLSFRRVN